MNDDPSPTAGSDPEPAGGPWTVPALLAELRLAREHSEALVADLDPDQIAWRPRPRSSAIGWHLGHQAAVAHYLMRNLTAAEPPLDPLLDRLFDSATPEPERGDLPPVEELFRYRSRSAEAVDATMERIAVGGVGAPNQLSLIADGLLRAVINHEYQHAVWVGEVRLELTGSEGPAPSSPNLVTVDGYPVLGPSPCP